MKPSAKSVVAVSLCALAVSGCYVVPVVSNDGSVVYHHLPIPPAGTPAPTHSRAASAASAATPVNISTVPAGPIVLAARLYPANDAATQTGIISGTVTNQMNGKGRFQFEYRGEVFSGEATVVDGDAQRGVANAFGSGGGHMNCEYQLASARLGAGACTFSNGAKYRLHIGA